jgi:hypothetical protein
MTMFPVIELLDRLAIARVKWRRTESNLTELRFYEDQMNNLDLDDQCHATMLKLEQIHDTIWDLEKELKSGQEHLLPLDEIGRRAIEIRNHNRRRIECKNLLAEMLQCPVREIKKDHLSE